MDQRILVVDDEATILFAMKEYLSGGGFTVDCAAEREEAQALIANVSYCAVIADLRLLGSDSGALERHRVHGRVVAVACE